MFHLCSLIITLSILISRCTDSFVSIGNRVQFTTNILAISAQTAQKARSILALEAIVSPFDASSTSSSATTITRGDNLDDLVRNIWQYIAVYITV